MATKANVLGGALQFNTSSAKVEQNALTEQKQHEQAVVEQKKAAEVAPGRSNAKKDTPIGVLFRLNSRDHETVSDYARHKGWSMQELLEHAVNAMRRSEGLSEIQGRPRGKKAGATAKR